MKRTSKRYQVYKSTSHNLLLHLSEKVQRILECAVSGRADLIVRGDKEMPRLKEYMGIKIASLRDYLES
jgi:predicted nucleic acid-binding protein